MRRRAFITSLGGAALAWPLVSLAQQAVKPIVGYLGGGSAEERAQSAGWFREGLKEGGYVAGKDVVIEYRWAGGRDDRLPALAAELVNRKVAVIATSGGPMSALAAKSATSTIPIVFVSAFDPVRAGLVANLGHPGGNVTGVSSIANSLDAKRLEVLHELVPAAKKIIYLVNPNDPAASSSVKEVLAAAELKGVKVEVLRARSRTEIDAAFTGVKRLHARALLVATNALFTTLRAQLIDLAARHSIPASYSRREYVAAGGLMSYGPDYADVYRQVGRYTARILKGAKPADLPVIQEPRINLVVNLATAKKLGLAVSRDFLARVDEVIE